MAIEWVRHTEMSISDRLRITFAALQVIKSWKIVSPDEDHLRGEFPRTHHDFQTFPWPSFGS